MITNPVDVFISFDTTGSMYPALAEVRREIRKLIDDLFNKFPNLQLGIAGHGNLCDYPIVTAQTLTSDRTLLSNFVSKIPNTNGGGYSTASGPPACYERIFHLMNHMDDWRVGAEKILIMIGDSVPHKLGDKEYRYSSSNVCTEEWKNEIKSLADNGIKVFSVQCLGRSAANSFYQKVAQETNGKRIELSQFSQIMDLLTLAIYSIHDEEMAEEFAKPLLFNNGFRRMAQQILGKDYQDFNKQLVQGLEPVASTRFQTLHVDHEIAIKEFVNRTGARYKIGKGFYQLTKSETVQEKKEVVLRDKITGDMYSGIAAREMIGIPFGERGKVRPGYFKNMQGEYEVFIQSTSVNRKLQPHTMFLYEAELD